MVGGKTVLKLNSCTRLHFAFVNSKSKVCKSVKTTAEVVVMRGWWKP